MKYHLDEKIIAMQREFKRPYYLEEGGCGVSWKLCVEGKGDILRAATRPLLLRDMQNYIQGMRDA